MPSSQARQDVKPDGGLLILWGGIDPMTTDETGLNDWWTNEHLPERLRLPGFQRARRYRAIGTKDGQSEYLACYEVSDVQDLTSPEYMHALNNPTSRTKQFMPCLAAMHRSACRIHSVDSPTFDSQASNALILFVLQSAHPDTESIKNIQSGFTKNLIQMDCFRRGIQTHIAIQDEAITKAGSTSKSYDSVQFTQERGSSQQPLTGKYIALFELSVSKLAKRELATVFDNEHFHAFVEDLATVNIQVGYRNTFKLIASLPKSDIEMLTE